MCKRVENGSREMDDDFCIITHRCDQCIVRADRVAQDGRAKLGETTSMEAFRIGDQRP